ncbi:MAG: hypothetical protein LRY71_06535 [Bacillaceae bacterium]|nr:hypothetical protein [Bacillaceae bacterium]
MCPFTLLVLLGLSLLLALPAVASASSYSGNYSFNIIWEVVGSYSHNLANKRTTTTVTADTYTRAGDITRTKDTYRVFLQGKGWRADSGSTTLITADGGQYTRSFGTLDGGTYRVVVRKVSGTGDSFDARSVRGSGTINQ